MTEQVAVTQKFTNARLNAVQALYAAEFSDKPITKIIFQFLNGEIGEKVIVENEKGKEEFVTLPDMDHELFANIVQEAVTRKEDLDKIISEAVISGWENDRIEILLQSILRAGLAEFFANPKLDAPVIINEYTDIARSFYEGPEVALVNAVLNNFAKVIKS
ncbi:MAG: transcription antitermination factor NusB [Alphaproteobacteria bacterium]|nr:transcription antitermination factor NusB [Alphaproteobacteria bacterium]